MGIKARILAPVIFTILAVALAIMISNIVMFSIFVDASTVNRVDAASRVVAGSLDALKAEARAVSLSMARHPEILNAIESGDREALLSRLRALQDESGVEFCTATDSNGVVLARTHAPEIFGDSLLNQANIRSAVHGEQLTVIEEGSLVRLSVRSGSPVFGRGGAVLGVVSVGFRLDTEVFVDKIKEMMGCETTIVLGDERIASTVTDEHGVRIIGTKADAHIAETVLDGASYSGRVDIEGETAVCKYTPLHGPDGPPLGMVFVGQYLQEETRTVAAFVRGGAAILFVMLAVSVAVILPVVWRVDATIKTQGEKIQKEHERVKLLLDATPMVSRLWDRSYRLIECNEAAVAMFGLKDKREYIERYYELSPEYQPDGRLSREKSQELVREAFEKGVCVYEWTYRLPDGKLIPAEATMVRVPYGDDFVVAGYSRDLREHKKMMAEIKKSGEELEAALIEAKLANSAKSSFLAQMSHEIRTPLNAVVGLSELALDEDELDDELMNRLEKIHSSGMTILSIVNNILDISKIESGKFEIFPTRYDTPSLINDILTLNVVHIGEKPVEFKLELNGDFPGMLRGDDLRVKQVFNNLLSNAFKYTNAGKVEWRLDFEREGDAGWIVSTVADTGVGIKREDIARLFSEYNQVDAAVNRKVEGTGLGLAITKRLVEMMDGSITVESEYGKGSRFTVRLRQELAADTPIGQTVAENLKGLRYRLAKRDKGSAPARVDLSYAHVLVVDDIATNLDVVKGILKPYKMKIDCAFSGRRAIELIEAENPRYSAVFMDHMMPEMDGIEATRIIREEIGTQYAKNIPIIALTANAIVGNEEMFLSRGFQAFLTKPIDMAKLDAVLRLWVRDKSREGGTETSAAKAEPAPSSSARLPKGIKINGIDREKALERFGGDEAVFLDILRSYAVSTRPLLLSLRACLEKEDLSGYAIAVHGVKGSSYGILAQTVGSLAEELEQAARSGDIGAVMSAHGAFESAALALLDELDMALGPAASALPAAARPDPALLRELHDACAEFKMDRVDAAMKKLEAVRYESGAELVAWLREKVDGMAFEEIVRILMLDGIDIAEGLRHSGSMELFTGILGSFYSLIDFKTAKLEKSLASGSVRDVTVEAHALKGTAALVGAFDISEGFGRLERYGREERTGSAGRA